MELKEQFFQLTEERFHRAPDQCDDKQLYEALLLLTKRMAEDRPAPETGRKLYYFSAEFLMGKLLSNNLLALGLYDQVRNMLTDLGSPSPPWATAGWAGWPPASWIPLQRWGCLGTA